MSQITPTEAWERFISKEPVYVYDENGKSHDSLALSHTVFYRFVSKAKDGVDITFWKAGDQL